MRRAEKAGRESADAYLEHARDCRDPSAKINEALSTRLGTPSEALINEAGRDEANRWIGARNLYGRAYRSALDAYDRGYRARLAEALETLTKGTP